MNHIWTVLCQRSSIDYENNLVSLFSCLEELSVVLDPQVAKNKKAVVPAEMQLVSFWTVANTAQENVLEIKGELIDPQGEVLNSYQNKFSVKTGVERFRNRTNIQGLPLTIPGRYVFRLWQKSNGEKEMKVVAELPLEVKISYQLLDTKMGK